MLVALLAVSTAALIPAPSAMASIGSTHAVTRGLTKCSSRKVPSECAVLWDVDGTLCDSTDLGFQASNEVLSAAGYDMITTEVYNRGARFCTPDRFNDHVGLEPGDEVGVALGQEFDALYVDRVDVKTAGLFPGIERTLRSLALAGHPQGVLSNAAGAYVRAVLSANELDESFDAGQLRMGIFGVALGADEVPAPKPAPDGLLACCDALGVLPARSVYVGDSPSDAAAATAAGMQSIGVLWGANADALRDSGGGFDMLVEDVPELVKALRDTIGDQK